MAKKMVKNIHYMLKLAKCPLYLFMMILDKCLSELKWAVLLVIFLNGFLKMVETGEEISHIAVTLGSYAIVVAVIEIYSVFFNHYYKPGVRPKVQAKFKERLFEKSAKADLEDFDDPEYYNKYIWSLTKSEEIMDGIFENIAALISNIIITLSISGLFFLVNFWIAAAVFVSVGVTVYIYSFIIAAEYEKERALSPYIVKAEYFKRVFYLKKYSKELRMTDIGSLLLELFDENEENICRTKKKFGKRSSFYNTMNGLTISTLLDIGMRILLTYHLMVTKTITLGEFTAASYAIWSLFSSLNGLMGAFNSFSEYALRIDTIAAFLEQKPKIYGRGEINVMSENNSNIIGLENVCFSYDEKSMPVLQNINFQFRQGETVAIVGENGSGKSTLVKILLGLYEPTSGSVMVNGQNLSTADITKYHNSIGIIFQDFAIFSASLAQNIALDINYNADEIKNALKSSLFYEDNGLKNISIDATMTREFDDKGIVLSGGQEQKFVVSRAFLNKQYIVMDEPSSALDTKSEMRLNELVMKSLSDKGILIIAHRLTTAKQADRIVVLSDGKIIEEGSHAELMEKRGKYYKMFTLQAKQYSLETGVTSIRTSP